MNEQLNILDAIDRAKVRASVGVARAVLRAGTDWQEAAYDRLRRFVAIKDDKDFLAEEFISFAYQDGLWRPPDPRAFGGIMRRAAARGLIVRIGYGRATSSNMSPKCLWQRKF